jgi:large subunit ribosomal protein L13
MKKDSETQNTKKASEVHARVEYIVDVSGMKLGRAASKIAALAMGKSTRTFVKNQAAAVSVVICNVNELSVSLEKRTTKTYARFSGYPGGLRLEKMDHLIAKKGMQAVLMEAVTRMIPRNSLRSARLKNISFK